MAIAERDGRDDGHAGACEKDVEIFHYENRLLKIQEVGWWYSEPAEERILVHCEVATGLYMTIEPLCPLELPKEMTNISSTCN